MIASTFPKPIRRDSSKDYSFCIDRDSIYVADQPGEPCRCIGKFHDVLAEVSPMGEAFRAWWEASWKRATELGQESDFSGPRPLRVVR
jgi:hypothetical protein